MGHADDSGKSLTRKIPGQKKREKTLRGSGAEPNGSMGLQCRGEETFESIFLASPIGIELYDADGRLIEANPACLEIFRVEDPAQLGNFNLFEDPNVPGDVIDRLRAGENVRREIVFDFEKVRQGHLYDTTGTGIVFLDVSITSLRKGDGEIPAGYVVQVLDVTEKHHMIKALEESESRLRAILRDQVELIARFLPDEGITFANDAFRSYFDAGYGTSPRRCFAEYIHPEDRSELKKLLAPLGPENPVKVLECRSLRTNGEICWQRWTIKAIFDESGQTCEYQAVGSDITDRKKLEDRWKKYECIADASSEFIVLIDSDYNLEVVNESCCKARGVSRSELEGSSLIDVWGEKAFNLDVRKSLVQCFEGKTVRAEAWLQFGDGVPRFYDLTCYPYFGKNGRVTHAVGVAHDITEYKLMHEALKRSEEKYRSIFEYGVIGIFQATLEGKHISLNSAFARMLGYESPEEMKRLISDIALQCYADPRQRSELLEKIKGEDGAVSVESVLLRKNGRKITVNQNIRLVRDEKGVPLYLEGFIEDITGRKKMEKAIRDSERRLKNLSSRLLVAQEEERQRIAVELHDSLGQSLAAIKYGVENIMISSGGREKDKAVHSLDLLIPIIQDAIEEARRIYMGLRPSILDDLGVVTAIGWLCGQFGDRNRGIAFRQSIEIEEQSIPKPLKIVIFRVIEEALNNVARHSRAHSAVVSLAKGASTIDLKIEDDGEGFSRDPLHPEAEAEEGLGLAGMKERIALSGGSLEIRSDAGIGTKIIASWPFSGADKK